MNGKSDNGYDVSILVLIVKLLKLPLQDLLIQIPVRTIVHEQNICIKPPPNILYVGKTFVFFSVLCVCTLS